MFPLNSSRRPDPGHPAWCDPANCTASLDGGGDHATAMLPAGVNTNRPEPLAAYLMQPPGGVPLIVVHAPSGVDPQVLVVSVREAWHLASILAQLARTAEAGR